MADEECLCDIVSVSAAASSSAISVVSEAITSTAIGAGFAIAVASGIVTDTAQASADVVERAAYIARDQAHASSQVEQRLIGSRSYGDRARAADRMFPVLVSTMADSAIASSEVFDSVRAGLVSSAMATEEVLQFVTTRTFVADTARARGFIPAGQSSSVESSAQASSTAIDRVRRQDVVTSSASASSEPFEGAVPSAGVIVSTATASEQLFHSVRAASIVEDWFHAEAEVAAGGDHMAWTCEAQTFGMSRFAIPGAQSAAVVDGVLCVAGDGGIFRAAGSPLESKVVTGLTDFGAEQLKRAGYLYLNYQAGGSIGVSVGVTASGSELTYNYSLSPRADDAMVPGRVKLGKGLRSRSWRFTIRNQPGHQFQIHDLQLVMDSTSRRV